MTESLPPLLTVVFVATPSALGGSNRSLVTLLDRLALRVTRIVIAPGDGALEAIVAERGLAEDFIPLPRKRRGGRLSRIADAARIARFVVPRRREIDAIHANATTGLYLASLAAILSRVRLVVWIHDPVSTRWGRLLGPWLRRLLPEALWCAVSPVAREVIVANGLASEDEVLIVPNPIDPVEVTAEPSPRESLGATRIAYLGDATRRKGFDLLPTVIAETRDLPVEWKLFTNRSSAKVLADVWDELDSLDGAHIDERGRVRDIRQAFAQCDIIFNPARLESFSRLTAEAMLNGLPVVASDIPALRALIGNNEAGLLFPSGDAVAAAAAIRKLVGNDELHATLSRSGLARSGTFDPAKVAEQLLEAYRSVRT